MCVPATSKLDDAGKSVDIEVSEHTPRRAGAQFHAKRGLALWQIQYIGRWGSSTVELYVAEAVADTRAHWSRAQGSCQQRLGEGTYIDEQTGVQLWEVQHAARELVNMAGDIQSLKQMLEAARIVGSEAKKALGNLSVEEASDLAEEANCASIQKFTVQNVAAWLASGRAAFVVNKASGLVHGVDLKSIAEAPPTAWATACGWKLCADDVGLVSWSVDAVGCSRRKCRDLWQLEEQKIEFQNGEVDKDEDLD